MEIIKKPIAHFSERPDGQHIDMLVLHSILFPLDQARATLEEHKVSSHYIIDIDGKIYELVAPEKRAWHAGKASWHNENNINDRSIGIEILNPTGDVQNLNFDSGEFSEAQIASTILLCRDLMARFGMPAGNLVAHSDIAPTRKQDPGSCFPWAKLAASGVGIWQDAEKDARKAPDLKTALTCLQEIGYKARPGNVENADNRPAMAAFQRRFTPHRLDGELDEVTMARIHQIHQLYQNAAGRNLA